MQNLFYKDAFNLLLIFDCANLTVVPSIGLQLVLTLRKKEIEDQSLTVGNLKKV